MQAPFYTKANTAQWYRHVRKNLGNRNCEISTVALRGLFPATVESRPAVVEYEPDADLWDTEGLLSEVLDPRL